MSVPSGRFRGEFTSVTVSGTVDGSRRAFVVEATEQGSAGPSIAKVWARANITELSDRQATAGDPRGELSPAIRHIELKHQGELGAAIRRIELKHQLVSNYTSFVAVDSSELSGGQYVVTVHQAVPVPAGVRYETTVATDGN